MQVTIITAAPERNLRFLGDIWRCRYLFVALVGRDLRVRYKQTLVGMLWVVVQPVALMVVMTVFFGYLGRFPSDGIPYPLFAYSALLPWTLFSRSLSMGSDSVVTNQALVQKIQFPRIILPAAAVANSLVDFVVAFGFLIVLLAYFGIAPGWSLLAAPIMIVLTAAVAFAMSLFLSALNVRFRDVRQVLPLLVQVWMFASPVIYPSSMVPEGLRPLYGLNPMVGAIEGFRWAVIANAPPPDWIMIGVSCAVVVILLITGLIYFSRSEQTFADRL